MSSATARASLDDPAPERAAELIRDRTSTRPDVAIVLGSGQGGALGADLRPEAEVAFADLPGFPASQVPGHVGKLILGHVGDAATVVFAGRVHFYEGHGMAAATLIPRLAAALGARALLLTNAAGGLDPSMRPGELMLIRDHVNWMGVNPLTGWRTPDGAPAFVDLSHVYDSMLLEAARASAVAAGVAVRVGVYVAAAGPSYETPAEVAALASMGADAVGMSTVPEAVAGAALGLRVLGVSLITNLAGREATHRDVLAAAEGAVPGLRAILGGAIPAAAGS